MKINTKFNIGDTVYRIGEREPLVISRINTETNENECSVDYLCNNGEWYLDSELTAERPKPKLIYDLKVGDEYFTLLTIEEAEKEAKRLKIHQQLKKLAGEYTFEFGENNYYIEYDFFPYWGKGHVDIRKDLFKCDPFKIYFKSELDALNAINEIGAETLMRDYFRIED